MSQTPAIDLVDPSAYALDLEMSLLLPSSAPAPWSPAVHEAARLIGRSWQEGESKPTDLLTLALLLFARTHGHPRSPGRTGRNTAGGTRSCLRRASGRPRPLLS
ncbi:hypothetical protein ACWENA_11180 [Streptomyces sp. NPDC004779]